MRPVTRLDLAAAGMAATMTTDLAAGDSPRRPRRPRPEREAPEIAAMVGRVLRALARRAEAGDLDALEELRGLRDAADAALVAAARGAHDGRGHYSWTEIANCLGITRQAARQRFGGD